MIFFLSFRITAVMHESAMSIENEIEWIAVFSKAVE
jgi:hypothetical protein